MVYIALKNIIGMHVLFNLINKISCHVNTLAYGRLAAIT